MNKSQEKKTLLQGSWNYPLLAEIGLYSPSYTCTSNTPVFDKFVRKEQFVSLTELTWFIIKLQYRSIHHHISHLIGWQCVHVWCLIFLFTWQFVHVWCPTPLFTWLCTCMMSNTPIHMTVCTYLMSHTPIHKSVYIYDVGHSYSLNSVIGCTYKHMK